MHMVGCSFFFLFFSFLFFFLFFYIILYSGSLALVRQTQKKKKKKNTQKLYIIRLRVVGWLLWFWLLAWGIFFSLLFVSFLFFSLLTILFQTNVFGVGEGLKSSTARKGGGRVTFYSLDYFVSYGMILMNGELMICVREAKKIIMISYKCYHTTKLFNKNHHRHYHYQTPCVRYIVK
ncbi:hypothetical protein L873DRAFT_1382909 [Choiromyces venosus 120613-1]|uniref:Uncharacterized protein n=1 Tax=Choiromyces venosus 120613-1 TaxID=1336337 RepID=A0A3N4JDC8_9PEZI|nr:hypothetical protein L873DRAFT_1382909 [Choiromyces venosus 120613-1]